ncbi:MAG: Asp-tRNA(Asn)/Glu-tRNA(Gln) amidotransferase subunit GatB [Verrucomicrobiae bacterium]|nr:Asp-tRNA(Asn)/Glu-tRNA(Gln) amidotransferase subunit GatB [Verrucomicrobiae bacterium]
MPYEAVIGLEVHVQIKTATKMFCGCRNEFGAEPNTNVCPVCLGYPGALPTPNREAIVKTIATGLMLHCEIAKTCKFDRKNYFYPDMPKNYQISQYDQPLCLGGRIDLYTLAFPKDAQKQEQALNPRSVRLHRIHLEEDVAKSFHFEGYSGIDFNRAGTPLMEIVSEADIRTPEEAFAYLTALKQILIYGNISDADMEKGQMRCDVNVSVRPAGATTFGTKCEIKNLNSISAVRRALAYEIDRQIQIVSQGGTIRQETRRWDDARGQTYVMRTKEQAHDYRYFPDPDLMPIRTDDGLLKEAESLVPELPAAKKKRFQERYGLSEYQASVLASERSFADYFELAAQGAKQPSLVANYLTNDYLAAHDITEPVKIPAAHFAQLANLVDSGKINSKQAREVLAAMFESGEEPEKIVQAKGMTQMSDIAELERLCDEAIAANPRSVADFKAGKEAAINAFKGYIMKATKGKAHPQLMNEILRRKLTEGK